MKREREQKEKTQSDKLAISRYNKRNRNLGPQLFLLAFKEIFLKSI